MQNILNESPAETQANLRRRTLSFKGLCIGFIAGLLAVGFRIGLESAERLRNVVIVFSVSHGYVYWVATPLLSGLLIALVVYVTSRFAPDAGGSGIPHIKGYLDGFLLFRARRILLVKFIGGVIGIGSGLALGREGPTVQMGGAVAEIMGDFLSPNGIERKILVSAGAGAGLAAAFNAPLAGIFFVIEELYHNISQNVLVTAFASCVTANVVCRIFSGESSFFHVTITHYPTVRMIPFFLLLGVFLGLAGFVFNKILLRSSAYVQQFTSYRKTLLALFIGIGLGAVGLMLPESLGTGAILIEQVLNSKIVFSHLLFFFVLRFFFTIMSYSTGAPGGIFSPLLLLGALAGAYWGCVVLLIYPESASFDFSVWGVLGMAGFFSAIIRAPITGIVLILEMTNTPDLLLPLMLVSIISYSIPEYFRDKPIYDALLQWDLSRKSIKP